MRIVVNVHLKSNKPRIENKSDGLYDAWLSSAPEKNKANMELISLVAGFLQIGKGKVRIVSGAKSREKVLEINL